MREAGSVLHFKTADDGRLSAVSEQYALGDEETVAEAPEGFEEKYHMDWLYDGGAWKYDPVSPCGAALRDWRAGAATADDVNAMVPAMLTREEADAILATARTTKGGGS
jgi:hypothetical protein